MRRAKRKRPQSALIQGGPLAGEVIHLPLPQQGRMEAATLVVTIDGADHTYRFKTLDFPPGAALVYKPTYVDNAGR